ncbi:MAG: hypothetical protein IJ447_01325 [Clostridia bacterium]|nr:hypothetical protein [Clostridia bacterium]
MLKNKKLVNTVCTVLIVAVMIYLFQDVFKSNSNKYETEMADEVTVQDVVELDAFIVRDEQYIDGNASGTVVPLVSDGDRVASGDAVARVCAKEQDAADYAELEETRKTRDRYVRLSEQTELNALDMEKLNEDIDSAYTDLLELVNSRDYDGLSDYITDLEESYASKQVLRDGTIDLTETIAALDKRIAELEAKNISANDVLAPLSGYYISNLDGQETTLRYDDIDSLSVALVDSALKHEPAAVSEKIGKIVASYKWYIVANIESKYSRIIEVGDTMKVNIPEYGYENVKVKVEKLSSEQDGRIAIALSCNVMDETYANMRIEDIELVIAEYTGYRVKTSAIHTYVPEDETTTPTSAADGETTTTTTTTTTVEKGEMNVVYILRGTVMNARKVEVIYTDGDYSIVSKDTKSEKGIKPIQRYDEVIVKGRNLKNGRSIG